MQASRPAGKYEPPVAYARLSGKRYDMQRRIWKTIRVVKKASANRVLERKLGYIDPSAKMKVGSSIVAHKQKMCAHDLLMATSTIKT